MFGAAVLISDEDLMRVSRCTPLPSIEQLRRYLIKWIYVDTLLESMWSSLQNAGFAVPDAAEPEDVSVVVLSGSSSRPRATANPVTLSHTQKLNPRPKPLNISASNNTRHLSLRSAGASHSATGSSHPPPTPSFPPPKRRYIEAASGNAPSSQALPQSLALLRAFMGSASQPSRTADNQSIQPPSAARSHSGQLEHDNSNVNILQPIPTLSSRLHVFLGRFDETPVSKQSRAKISIDEGAESSPGIRNYTTKIEKTKAVMEKIVGYNNYSLGDFLQHIFEPETVDQLPPSSAGVLRSWVRGGSKQGTRPAEIVDANYRHPAGITRDKSRRLPHPSFQDLSPPGSSPAHANAHPRDISLLPNSGNLSAARLNSREGLEEWMVRGTLLQVEREAEALVSNENGLPRGAGITWDLLDDMSDLDQRDAMRSTAPVIWAIMSTIAFLHRPSRGGVDNGTESGTGAGMATPTQATVTNDNGNSSRRDPTLGIMFAISILLSFRNPLVNFVQSVVAVFLFACNTHKTVYRTLNRVGLSTAHSTLHGHLKELGKSTREALKGLGLRAYESARGITQQPHQYFMLIFDNVNKYHNVSRNQTVGQKNQMKNGTAATAVVLEDVPPDAFNPKPYHENIDKNARQELTTSALFGDIDNEHLSQVGAGMIMRILLAYIPSLSRELHEKVEEKFKTDYAKHRLRLRRSITFSFGTSSIEENTARGVSDVTHDLVGTQMEMKPSWFEYLLIMIGGDQLSIDRLHKAKRCKSAEQSVYESRSWILPIIQLWHMKLAYLRSIFRVHWFDTVRTHLLGLHHGAEALGRQVNPAVNDFYACHNVVKTVFEAMVLTATFVVLQEETQTVTSNHNHMTDQLATLFATGGPLDKYTFARLEGLATRIYTRFMTQEAFRRTLSLPATLDKDFIYLTVQRALDRVSVTSTNLPTEPNLEFAPDTSTSHSIHPNADQMLGNLVLLMRDTFLYLEFASAIPEGDVGRVMEVVKMLRFSFWGSKAANYGKELLEMACQFKFEYPEALRTAILNNYLVNPSGLNGHWQEGEFFQEHSNKVIKTVFNTKNSDWDSSFLRDVVSVNIQGLSLLREKFLQFLGLNDTGSGRSKPNYCADINILAAHYLDEKAFTFHSGRRQDALAEDMVQIGYDRLDSGILSSFIERTISARQGLSEDDADVLAADLDQEPGEVEVEIPMEPLIMHEGALMADEVEIEVVV
ncbi:putative protein L294 [Acanthamoeba polyphaga mimivirus] [Rhizoctonia solani]|uniref:DUF6589 domain-containing protein n=1 Tax=Rhizoctonia solani TaxID=456999 RepID=A0A0K6FQV9_9AGAM|nr:putative protein L294 [Acanthamoeba polyphaga mimivirus] [Rhizoctonia solani]